ncbi:MAG: UDP-N-acetylmuramate--L-alanine ligase [Firmicutes bacterium]|nr:UDP-N-acetylmuramate--L-alanine ligase [[Eubacterium] siraeum]MCM1488335.1 UDP-N-acetylmuramate--L-alanine ligase [Bacillota bacterium]
MEDFLTGKKHIHFIGIGGSGMYPLAQILHSKGFYLTGSDNNETETLDLVRKMEIPVYLGQRAENINGADLIVYTAAIMEDNPELIAARESGVKTVERAALLGLITTKFSNSVCISGTHGKTTATSMLTQIFLAEKVDISAVIGGKLKAIGGSGIAGSSDTLVCEACEFLDHFLSLSVDVAVVLNVDADHLDYFKNLDNIIRSFHTFCEHATKAVIINGDDANSMKALEGITNKDIITFGRSNTNDWYPENIIHSGNLDTSFTVMHNGKAFCNASVHVPGEHNIINALAAAAAAHYSGATAEGISKGLDNFTGAGRRFEKYGAYGGITVVDDYGHHPAEISATLQTAKNMNFKRVWAIHQPFTYSRTFTLMEDFAKALSIADKVVLTEIMGSREKNTFNVYAKDLSDKIQGCVWFPEFQQVADHVCENAKEGDLIITLGCGDVYKVARIICAQLKKKYGE